MTNIVDDDRYMSLLELEQLAERNLAKSAFDYYASGAGDEITLAENRSAFGKLRLRPKVLVDVRNRDMSVELFGMKHSMPILVAPTAFQRLAHPDGELATACAAEKLATTMVVSTLATASVAEIRENSKANLWFQLYVLKDREITRELLERAVEAQCTAIVVTVDAPVIGRRERDMRNRFQLPSNLSISNLVGLGKNLSSLPDTAAESGLAAYFHSLYDTSLTWKDIEWLRKTSPLPVIVKGVLRGDDAKLAVDSGVDGIVVSNHGGRQLDTAVATIDALPEVAEAVDGKVPILLDGGIRRGTDIVKAIALGATAVLVGRPILWGLSYQGEAGVTRVLENLKMELDNAMALIGAPNLGSITPDFIVRK
jgi:L-lactate dehydrogenase (FMN-dependent) and related alpha-hydroxy acid dehydrogenases